MSLPIGPASGGSQYVCPCCKHLSATDQIRSKCDCCGADVLLFGSGKEAENSAKGYQSAHIVKTKNDNGVGCGCLFTMTTERSRYVRAF